MILEELTFLTDKEMASFEKKWFQLYLLDNNDNEVMISPNFIDLEEGSYLLFIDNNKVIDDLLATDFVMGFIHNNDIDVIDNDSFIIFQSFNRTQIKEFLKKVLS